MDGFRRPRPSRPRANITTPSTKRTALPQSRPVATPGVTPHVSMPSRPVQPTISTQPPGMSPHPDRAPHPEVPPKTESKTARAPRRRWPWIVAGLIVVAAEIIAGAYWWYQEQLRPVSDDDRKQSLVITDGDSVATIAKKLKDAGLIRSDLAFQVYVRLSGKSRLQAGSCRLSPAQSVSEMIDKIAAGCRDFKAITFYPGGTLESSLHKASRSSGGVDKSSVRYVLQQAGYSDQEITEAFRATYESPLFAGKPADAPLEGYIFGETYHVAADASAKQVLEAVFAHMYEVVKKHNIEERLKSRGLTLYQGIILASIVERELTCEDKPTAERKERCYQYQRGIAQVFLKRYAAHMQLGSDITAVYAADREGITIPKNDTTTLLSVDSPYNTRKYTGLPPTPIAAPGELALKAVAMPTEADNVFFLAGDDGLIYFAKTDEEHQANIQRHCQVLCKTI